METRRKLWDTSLPGNFLWVPRDGSLGGQLQLFSGSTLPTEGTEKVGEAEAGLYQEGGWKPGPWAIYMWWWCSQFCCTEQRHGWWRHALGECWEDSTTGWPSGWQRGNLGEGGKECGYSLCWMTWWMKQDCKRWKPTYPAARTWPHSSLWPGPLWDRGQGYPSGGGIRMGWIWNGYRWRIRRRKERTCTRRRTGLIPRRINLVGV